MTRLLLVALLAAGCQRTTVDNRTAPSRNPVSPADAATEIGDVPAPVVAPVAIDPEQVLASLRELGKRLQNDLRRQNASLDFGEGVILARRPCKRPTPAARAALERVVLAANPGAVEPTLRVGCQDPGGIIVDIAYDRVAKDGHHTGVWRVLRVTGSTVTKLIEHVGEARENWMEWSDERTVSAFALVDLDRDGIHDALLSLTQHEGGATHGDDKLSLWFSKTRRIVPVTKVGDGAGITLSQPPDEIPVVIAIIDNTATSVPHYRCIEADGSVDRCAAIEPARELDRQSEVLNCFADHLYCPYTKAPDREQLGEMLDTLHIPRDEQAPLLAGVPTAEPVVRVSRVVARTMALELARHSTLEPQSPDPRPDQLMAMLGDARCTPATPSESQAATALIAAWIAANDRAALIAHGDCAAGTRCKWSRRSKPVIGASCVADRRGYFTATWDYHAGSEMLARSALFWSSGAAVSLIAAATAAGKDFGSCHACDPPPEAKLSVKLHRHGATLVALADAGASDQPVFTVAADGVATPIAGPRVPGWYAIGGSYGVLADDVAEVYGSNEFVLWHWDGAWKQLTVVPRATLDGKPPTDQIGAWLWHHNQRSEALELLEHFDVKEWTAKVAYRADVLRALELFGATPETLALVRSMTP